jgi:glucokinase
VIGAVDIGGTKIAVGMVSGSGQVLSKVERPTDTHLGYSSGLERIAEMLREAAKSAAVEISGVGIGSTGPLDALTGEFGDVDFLKGWAGKNLVHDLDRIFDVPVAIENDADAAALGEANWGAGKNKSRLVYVTIGTGIGGGIVMNGQVHRGVDGSHPEIGHHVVDSSGPLCSCGFRGCWEALAAGPAMVHWLHSQASDDFPHGHDLTARRICELAREGDALAGLAVKREAYYLGLGLANLMNVLSPDAIVLGGSVMKSSGLFLDGIHETIRQGCRFVPFEKMEISLASLGEDANLIGAAMVWHHRFRETRRDS